MITFVTMLRRAVIAVIVGSSVVVGGVALAQSGGETTPSAPTQLTYWEARDAGYPVPPLPQEVGLRQCVESDFHHGFKSAEAAEEALEAQEKLSNDEVGPDYCQVDPTTNLFFVMPQDGTKLRGILQAAGCKGANSTYKYVATIHCSENVEGVRDTIEVGDPSLCHSNCQVEEHVYGRVEANTQGGHGMESGWLEATWAPSGHHPTSSFDDINVNVNLTNLDVGTYYVFRVRHDGGGGGAGAVVAEYFDGSWHNLDTQSGIWCEQSGGGGNCSTGEATEVHSSNSSWFNLNAGVDGNGINHSNIMLRKASNNNWQQFKPSNFSEGTTWAQSPYKMCSLTDWFEFRTPKDNC